MYSIQIEDAKSNFSATHFLLLEATHKCSRLHGHNYKVNVTVQGPLDDNYFVLDFFQIKNRLQEITEPMDHHVLVPMESDGLTIEKSNGEVSITTPLKRYVLPEGDITFLPIAATTSELLAKYIFDELKNSFSNYKLRVSVSETSATKGIYEET
ncbi:MAG TPA: 6-carboxytetrahydropterin synthase [Candidatus Lokiarchaeia archaeon]|nr:6-carboxytetrahydropterin synthase [Candidatus Lokiarchaeia archaeon]